MLEPVKAPWDVVTWRISHFVKRCPTPVRELSAANIARTGGSGLRNNGRGRLKRHRLAAARRQVNTIIYHLLVTRGTAQ